MAELISSKFEDGTLTIFFHRRVDSANAAAVQAETEEALAAAGSCSVIIDADDLQYISSAGLRIVLAVRKKHPELRVINASSEVYEIFEMTGFTEMITVEKGYRKISVEGCEEIGRGANGTVYRMDEDTIIKVYNNPDSLPDIQRERELARRAFVLGVPTAIPYDVVRVGGSYGSVFELLNAASFIRLCVKEPENIDKWIDMSVDLLKIIHSTEVRPEDMPDMKAVAVGWVDFLKDYLDAGVWQKIHDLVDAVPESHMMMHGDYHMKNVMLQNGEALLIDMDTLAQGDPIFEFGSIYNAYVGFSELDHSVAQTFLGISYETAVYIWDRTIRQYFGTEDGEKLKVIEEKAKLMGYIRLMRRLIRRHGLENEEGRAAIDFYAKEIGRIAGSLDRLTF